ncbi:MAG: TlpA disulfide reductase family protein [Deltaproteobacteria bacterium]|jgi:thiol-disulfide isomerase/thioredoxin
MPQFKVHAVNRGEAIDSSTYQGQVLLINFFATWCPPCRQEIPGFIKLQKEFGPKGFSVIGISVDQGGSAIVKRFVDKIGINYPVGMGTTKVSEDFGGIIGIPATFLVNRKGNIVKSYRGYADDAVVAADIKELM